MPRKVFVAGEILTAADVNEFLSDQVVMTFAGTAARGSAIGTAVEGMVTYLEDTDSFEYWDSSAWVPLVPDFDLTTPVSGDSLVYDGTNWVNGPRSGNAIINGDFGVWQRGTSFSSDGYTADRWRFALSGATATLTQESFTPGDIEAIGYGDAEYFARFDISVGNAACRLEQRIEDVRTFAGQEVTLSFWGRANAAKTWLINLTQDFGSGGSSDVGNIGSTNFNLTTDWQRFTITFTIPSVSGKTIGSNSRLQLNLLEPSGQTGQFDFWGVQLEAGPVATPFKLAGGGSKAAELALCQRYFYRFGPGSDRRVGTGYARTSTVGRIIVSHIVEMRSNPSFSAPGSTGFSMQYKTTTAALSATPSTVNNTEQTSAVDFTISSGLTAGEGIQVFLDTDDAYLDFDAEL